MTIEDIKEYKRNAIEILRKNSQYATAKATEEAFDMLVWYNEVIDKMNSIPLINPINIVDNTEEVLLLQN